MIHQPIGGIGGQASDIERHAREVVNLKARLNNILVKHTGQSKDQVEKDTDRDTFLTPAQALEYGLIDEVVATRKKSSSEEDKDN